MIEPRHFLEIANQLSKDRSYDFEAGWRTVVNRAYYASFHTAMRKLQQFGHSFPQPDRIHKDVIDVLQDRDSKIANKLETLRSKRIDADYYLGIRVDRGQLSQLLKLAEVTIVQVESLKEKR